MMASSLQNQSRMASRRQRGFTLTELMVVVIIVGILAVIGINAYKKWIRKSKATEVPFMMGQFQTREESYRAENGTYLATVTDENPSSYYPPVASLKDDKTDCITGRPASWNSLRIAPGSGGLYCAYGVVAGLAGTAPTGAQGTALFGSGVTPQTNWFYVGAFCNWTKDTTSTYEQHWLRGDLATNTEIRVNQQQ